jgi:hypothetical protein
MVLPPPLFSALVRSVDRPKIQVRWVICSGVSPTIEVQASGSRGHPGGTLQRTKKGFVSCSVCIQLRSLGIRSDVFHTVLKGPKEAIEFFLSECPNLEDVYNAKLFCSYPLAKKEPDTRGRKPYLVVNHVALYSGSGYVVAIMPQIIFKVPRA